MTDLTPTKVEKKRHGVDQATAPTKVEYKQETLALTLPIPSQRRTRRRYQARWKPIELSTEAKDKLHACLSTLNSHNTAGKKHDIGIAYGEVLDFSPCHLVREAFDSFKLKRTVPGTTLFCSRCGRVTPVREKFQVSNTLCPARQKSTVPPRWRASAMDDVSCVSSHAFLSLTLPTWMARDMTWVWLLMVILTSPLVKKGASSMKELPLRSRFRG
eukprot:3450068-Amphidinium_carterae.1